MTDSVDELTEDMLDAEDIALFKQIDLGENARNFINSHLGRSMVNTMKADISAELQKLYQTPLWRKRKCQEIKNNIKIRELFLLMIEESFAAGDMAHQALINKIQDKP